MSESRHPLSVPPAIVALVGWLIPGAGYWLLNQRGRALAVGLTILVLFTGGLLIGGVRVAVAPDLFDQNSNHTALGRLSQRPWFIVQVLNGPVYLVSSALAKGTTVESHSHSNEIGTLYTAIAGMLNLLAIIDSSYRAGREESP